jgi:hypothetical protein
MPNRETKIPHSKRGVFLYQLTQHFWAKNTTLASLQGALTAPAPTQMLGMGHPNLVGTTPLSCAHSLSPSNAFVHQITLDLIVARALAKLLIVVSIVNTNKLAN